MPAPKPSSRRRRVNRPSAPTPSARGKWIAIVGLSLAAVVVAFQLFGPGTAKAGPTTPPQQAREQSQTPRTRVEPVKTTQLVEPVPAIKAPDPEPAPSEADRHEAEQLWKKAESLIDNEDRTELWQLIHRVLELVPDHAEAKDLAKQLKEEEERAKTLFSRRAKSVAMHFVHEATKVPGLELVPLGDKPYVTPPYHLIFDAAIQQPERLARRIGPALTAIRKAFRVTYKREGLLADWDDEASVAPVIVFKNSKRYEMYRKESDIQLPSTNLAAAFYVPANLTVSARAHGVLFVWQDDENDHLFMHKLLHEATHELMHSARADANGSLPPWLEEGFADYFGSHDRNNDGNYRFGAVLPFRIAELKFLLDRSHLLTPRELFALDNDKFSKYKGLVDGRTKAASPGELREARLMIARTYAQGWAWIFFCYNYDRGRYRKQFEQLLVDQLVNPILRKDDMSEYFDATTDASARKLAEEYFRFCRHELPRYDRGTLSAVDPTAER